MTHELILKMIEEVDPSDTAKLEIWKPLLHNDKYVISSLGNVKHVRGNTKKPYINSQGYFRITLYNKGRSGTCSVASLVAEAFYGPRPKGHFIDHINGIKTDNRVENLEYVTPRENTRRHYKSKRGTLGVYYCEKRKMWNAQISYKFDKITLGWFEEKSEAEAAYMGARKVIEKWMK